MVNNMNIDDIKNAIFYNKCKKDPIFFAENCVHVPEAGGSVLVKLYEPQKKVLRDFLNNHYLIFLKSRQTGASFISQVLSAWLVLFYPNYIIGVISRSGPESSDFVRKVIGILDSIPQDFIRPKTYSEKNMQNFKLPNGSRCVSQAVSLQSPENVFRGLALTCLIFDEAAFVRHADIAWTAVAPALSKTHDVAEQKQIPYGTIVLSTPNGITGAGEWFYKKWNIAINNEDMFIPHKIHWKEVGHDDEWFKKQCKLLDNDPRKIKQELELQFLSSDGSIWSDIIQEKLNEVKQSEDTQIIHLPCGGALKLFKNFKKNKFYFIGVDTASASSSDYSAVEVIDYETCEQIAEYKGKLEPKIFANSVVKVISNIFPNNLIIVENSGGYGLTVLNELQFDPIKEYNLYGEYKITGTSKNKTKKFILGLSTNSKSRPLILESLFNYVNNNLELINSELLALELLSLENKNGKIQATSGFNDDLCMALGFCTYVREYQPDFYSGMIDNTIEYAEDTTEEESSFIESFVIDMNTYQYKSAKLIEMEKMLNIKLEDKYKEDLNKDKHLTEEELADEMLGSDIFNNL